MRTDLLNKIMFSSRYRPLLRSIRRYTITKAPKKEYKPSKDNTVADAYKGSLKRFLKEQPQLAEIEPFLPEKFTTRKSNQYVDDFYLICPNVSKEVADLIADDIKSNENQVVCEACAGFGLISQELLNRGVKYVRLYESNVEFRNQLKDFDQLYPGRVEIFTKSLFKLDRYDNMDKHDGGNRVETLLYNIPKKEWTDTPVMTIIGVLPSLYFLHHVFRLMSLQTGLMSYGRLQFYVFVRPQHYAVLNATKEDNLYYYTQLAILSNIYLEYKLLGDFDRNLFIPWEYKSTKGHRKLPTRLNQNRMYFVQINFKKEPPIQKEDYLEFYHFLKHFYVRGGRRIIPTLESSIPNCGANLIVPTLKHQHYYEKMGIFTAFKELCPFELLSVFQEVKHDPSYAESTFKSMIESYLLRNETVETDIIKSKL